MGIGARFPHIGWDSQWWPHKGFQTGRLARLAGCGARGSDWVVVGRLGCDESEEPSPGAGEVYGRLECGQEQRPGRGRQSYSFEENRLLECELMFLFILVIPISVLLVSMLKRHCLYLAAWHPNSRPAPRPSIKTAHNSQRRSRART